LFQYEDENGDYQAVDSADVNAYLREISGMEFSAKDFRTWAGSVFAAIALQQLGSADSDRDAKKKIVEAIKTVSESLGNTPAVCRKCYVHPEIVAAYLDGTLERLGVRSAGPQRKESWMSPEESAVLTLLKRRLSGNLTRKRAA
jgi:DNA topoisomerase-1